MGILTIDEKYQTQFAVMLSFRKEWIAARPGIICKVQFNFPHYDTLISTISDALDCGLVTADENGLALIKALWPWGDTDEPTVLMVRSVLEYGSETS